MMNSARFSKVWQIIHPDLPWPGDDDPLLSQGRAPSARYVLTKDKLDIIHVAC